MPPLFTGFLVALQPLNLLWGLAGVTLGTAVGVLPGIGPALTVALFARRLLTAKETSATTQRQTSSKTW